MMKDKGLGRRGSNDSSAFPFVKVVTILVVFGIFIKVFFSDSDSNLSSSQQISRNILLNNDAKKINLATWNIAAINNNPFEYWITWNDKRYVNMMEDVSKTIKDPGSVDITVKEIFTDDMYNQLEIEMGKAGMEGLDKVREFWQNEYKNRKILSEFIKDSSIGKKRLASMPDRVTNTISINDKTSLYRPTVINCYQGNDLGTVDEWWKRWKEFIFDPNKKIYAMFKPISQTKYPAITTDEAAVSLPLQTLALAIFDATLVYLLNYLAPTTWQPLRSELCHNLNIKKSHRTVDILDHTYSDSEIIFMQEVGKAFIAQANDTPDFLKKYDIHIPSNADQDRDQNSLILTHRHSFTDFVDVTTEVLEEISGQKVPVAPGDLIVLTGIRNLDNTKYLLASFHGDTNGLATKPIVAAVHKYAIDKKPDHKLLFGMDANTYAHPESDQQGVVDFAEFYNSLKLNSCYGSKPDPENFTTFHARTYLQPQLNKAIAFAEKDIKGDKNPKDFIVFFDADFNVDVVTKDNTGSKKYIEGMVFPTLNFPSDHGVTSTTLSTKSPSS